MTDVGLPTISYSNFKTEIYFRTINHLETASPEKSPSHHYIFHNRWTCLTNCIHSELYITSNYPITKHLSSRLHKSLKKKKTIRDSIQRKQFKLDSNQPKVSGNVTNQYKQAVGYCTWLHGEFMAVEWWRLVKWGMVKRWPDRPKWEERASNMCMPQLHIQIQLDHTNTPPLPHFFLLHDTFLPRREMQGWCNREERTIVRWWERRPTKYFRTLIHLPWCLGTLHANH